MKGSLSLLFLAAPRGIWSSQASDQIWAAFATYTTVPATPLITVSGQELALQRHHRSHCTAVGTPERWSLKPHISHFNSWFMSKIIFSFITFVRVYALFYHTLSSSLLCARARTHTHTHTHTHAKTKISTTEITNFGFIYEFSPNFKKTIIFCLWSHLFSFSYFCKLFLLLLYSLLE